jgi:hypothetical protein
MRRVKKSEKVLLCLRVPSAQFSAIVISRPGTITVFNMLNMVASGERPGSRAEKCKKREYRI